jgi:tRNA modification GTPase
VAINKLDIADPAVVSEALAVYSGRGLVFEQLSARSIEDVDALRDRLSLHVVTALSGSEFPAATRLRHAERLGEARGYLERALSDAGLAVELAAEDVRLAARALARITGRIDAEAILDRVFSSFCIGK